MPHFLYNALYECVFYENKLILIPCTNGLQSIHTAYLNPIDFGGLSIGSKPQWYFKMIWNQQNSFDENHLISMNIRHLANDAHFKNTKKNVKDLLKYIWKIDKSSSI